MASLPPPPLPPARSPLFTPIPEHEKEVEEEDDDDDGDGDGIEGKEGKEEDEEEGEEKANRTKPYKHHPTTLHDHTKKKGKKPRRRQHQIITEHSNNTQEEVKCNKCRPSSREKNISIVPLDTNGRRTSTTVRSPSANMLKSIFSSIGSGKSPRPSSASSSSRPPDGEGETPAAEPSSASSSSRPPDGEGETTAAEAWRNSEDDVVRFRYWKSSAAELSRKLADATRTRDEALHESARQKQSMSDLEKKMAKLESYCHDLKSALDRCSPNDGGGGLPPPFPVEAFLRSVSEARTMVRHLSRALAGKSQHPPKSLEKISRLILPAGAGGGKSNSKSDRSRLLLVYLEALLNRVFYEDFETTGFARGSADRILDPYSRCESNRAAHERLKSLTWEEVLRRGTRHHCEDLSGFCDRKMSDLVGMLGWAGAWPERLLQAFFAAAKGVWLLHLLAWSAHPPVPPFRVEPGARFDPGYMDGVAADRLLGAGLLVQTMVAPGFYVHSSVVKCKVLRINNAPADLLSNSNTTLLIDHNSCERRHMDQH